MTFLILLSISVLAVAAYGLINNHAKNEPKKYIKISLVAGTISIPIVGLLQGTFTRMVLIYTGFSLARLISYQ